MLENLLQPDDVNVANENMNRVNPIENLLNIEQILMDDVLLLMLRKLFRIKEVDKKDTLPKPFV
jgi:hypothetical protein